MSLENEDWGEIVAKQESALLSQVGGLKLDEATASTSGVNNEKKSTTDDMSFVRKTMTSKGIKSGVERKQQDPNTPLFSLKTFEELKIKPNLLKGVYALGFMKPSRIQETALQMLLANPPTNMIAQSQNGTGKTAAFVLAMLHRIDTSKPYPQGICLSPTYELALQTTDVAKDVAKFCPDITFRIAVRGEEIPRGEAIREQVIFGTPGKVMDWAIKYRCFDISKVRMFVLDEADQMIATQGHRDQSIRIHRRLDLANCQIIMFSATYDQEVLEFAEAVVPKALVITLKREDECLDNVKQYYVDCRTSVDKYKALANIYGSITIGQAIIFCHTRLAASWLSEKLTRDGHAVALLSGELTSNQRITVLNRFRVGKEKVLITTNVCARGIDIEQVTMVVNFDLPVDLNGKPDFETYLHRIGRTGRFGKSGIAVNMLNYSTEGKTLLQIERHFGKKILPLDAEDVDKIEQIGRH